jgi:hypothetical protein
MGQSVEIVPELIHDESVGLTLLVPRKHRPCERASKETRIRCRSNISDGKVFE